MRLQKWAATGALLCATVAAIFPACDSHSKPDKEAEGNTKSSGAALSMQVPEGTDVSGFKIIVTHVSCNGEPVNPEPPIVVQSQLLDLDISVKVTADGSTHAFADTFISLPAGCYDVISEPIQTDGSPSATCAIAGADGVVVLDGLPTEIALVSQCGGQVDTGAVDVISLLNRPPQLKGQSYPQGKFVAHCDDQQVCATFEDPDGDPLEVVWSKKAGLPNSTFTVLPPTANPDGSITQCVSVDHAGPEMMLIEAKAFDLLKNPSGPGLIRFEDFYAQNGIPATSSDSFLFQAYGASSANCPCVANPEVCDGVDNDCDGKNDDNLPACVCIPIEQKPCYDGPPGSKDQGECNGGVHVCKPDGSGYGACIGEVTPVPETCPNGDGKDNDCNGIVDDCCVANVGAPCTVPGALGVCAQGTVDCSGLCMGPDILLPEECNGLDDDCDGIVDNNLVPAGGLCTAGVGACQKTGIFECVGGQYTCAAIAGQPSPEICNNGIDEDCNGMIDDCPPCVPDAGAACSVPGKVGACAPGTKQCDGSCKSNVAPATEICNGSDDDCDGQTDEGITGGACSAGIGACQSSGQVVCNAGVLSCNAVAGQPSPEVCGNAVDEDCNGVAESCGNNCVPNQGSSCTIPGQVGACAAGKVQCDGSCGGGAQPTAETCNSIDDNCNGQTDEGLTNGACSAGIGACQVAGQNICIGGTFVCNATPGQPSPEVCGNAIDEDCNGVLDNGCGCNVPNLGAACVDNSKQGTCQAGQITCNGCVSAVQPVAEICNGIDDDCDGQIDEGLAGGSCSAGTGACQVVGQQVCNGGAFACNAVPGQPSVEQCNGIDDDCDGQVDEGLVNGSCSKGSGACLAAGQNVCVNGVFVCNAVAGQPSAEVCNNLDDDCDGSVDEGLSGAPCSAGVGLCLASGQQVCNGGVYSCNAVPGTPQPEIACNGIDEDCNGSDVCNPCGNGVCDGGETFCTCPQDCAAPDPCANLGLPSYQVWTSCSPQEIQCTQSACMNNGDGTFSYDYITSQDWLGGCYPQAPPGACSTTYSLCPP